ncbi:hypothetical protein B0I35DRAFT_484691 [Stachybotrys elegans]|uniref:Uncharacterized protein n=1 Tax=Stachybotrys elegans TaxID=80388 RepID=A0A8K0WKG6_9HYPO|nr:hypothetical protein B0I35DRAFT_484691 [Stachybotrys elegans]
MDEDAPAEFSLEMMLTGADDSAPRKKYKLDVNGNVSFEVLVLLGLCQVRTGDVEEAQHHIADGEAVFENDGGVEAGLTGDFGLYIADRTGELLAALKSPGSTPLEDSAIEVATGLLEWAGKQVKEHANNDELLHRLQGLESDLRGVNQGDEGGASLADDLSSFSIGGEAEEKKSKLARFARNILGSGTLSKKSPTNEEEMRYPGSFSSDAITLVPSRTSTVKTPPGNTGAVKSPATSPHYHIPGELPPGIA